MQQRMELSNKFLAKFDERSDPTFGLNSLELVNEKLDFVIQNKGSVGDFKNQVVLIDKDDKESSGKSRKTSAEKDLEDDYTKLSDILLASFFANKGISKILKKLENIFHAYHILINPLNEEVLVLPILKFLMITIIIPDELLNHNIPGSSKKVNQDDTLETNISNEAEDIYNATKEIILFDQSHFLNHGGENDNSTAFTLSDETVKKITTPTRKVLDKLGIDLSIQPIDMIITQLDKNLISLANSDINFSPEPPMPPEDECPVSAIEPRIRPAGVADLLVVKQQIKRYEAGEIAHVENVLAKEIRSRTYRMLESFEETFISESEITQKNETELETAERFELNKESSKTIQQDQQYGFGLSLSGKYGPTIEFSSNFSAESSTSTQESTRSASSYAKDIVTRSLESITERVRKEQIQKIINETEETNLHEFNNDTIENIIGIYQFLDKIYETQVFNYGIREMFDFMVPEPASYLWYLQKMPEADLDLPSPPEKLEYVLPSANSITEINYKKYTAQYAAIGVLTPPPRYITVAANLTHGKDDSSESAQPRNKLSKEVTIPVGYQPYRALVRNLALTDDDLTIGITVGHANLVWKPATSEVIDVGSGHDIAASRLYSIDLTYMAHELDEQSKLSVNLLAFETRTYTVAIDIICRRTMEEFDRWRIKTYDKIAIAYQEQLQLYEQKVDDLEAEAEQESDESTVYKYGAPPSQNQMTIKSELKKHCISIISKQRFNAFDATKEGEPPYFDFDESISEGYFIRFFEQAFEWDQIQYVFYPYFWARKETWKERFLKQELDPAFREFLQAGSARVVLPVRPGFEVAVTHYLETCTIWNGDGSPPDINSPLYVSIIDEIKERTGADQGEVAVGDSWEARVPTALVKLKNEPDLPEWERVDPEKWDWRQK